MESHAAVTSPFDVRSSVLAAAALLVACSGAEPVSKPIPAASTLAAAPTATATATATGSAAAPILAEADSPADFTPRVLVGLPPTDARAAKEDLPPGVTCRIGSERLTVNRNYGPVVFASAERVYLEGLGNWSVHDATSGVKLDAFELGIVTSGLSAAGTCVAAKSGDAEIEYYKLPSRELVARRLYTSHDVDNVVPADDCSSAMRREDYTKPCVWLYGADLTAVDEICAGVRLGDSALSGDGKRAALVPSQMDEHTYEGDGVHVFDTASRERIALVKKAKGPLGRVALSRDGGLVAFTDGGEVRIAPVPSGAATSSFPLEKGASVRGLVFSPGAKRLAVSFETYRERREAGLAIVDVRTGKPLFTHRGLPVVGAVAFSPDGGRVAYVIEDGVRIIDALTGDERASPGRLFHLEGQAISASGDRAFLSSPGHLTAWDTRDCSKISDAQNDPPLDDLLPLPGGTAVVGFQHSAMVRVDLASGARKSLEIKDQRARDSQVVTPDGKTVILGIEDDKHAQRLVFVDVATMREVRRVTIPKVGPIGALLFGPGTKIVHAVAPGGLANGDSPMGDTSVVAVDVEKGGLGKRFTIAGAAQSYRGVVLEKGRVIVVEDDWREAATGKQLPRPERTLYAVSVDQRTALWSDVGGTFLWPVDDPLPATAPAVPAWLGQMFAGRDTILQCRDTSCLIVRAGAKAGSGAVTP